MVKTKLLADQFCDGRKKRIEILHRGDRRAQRLKRLPVARRVSRAQMFVFRRAVRDLLAECLIPCSKAITHVQLRVIC